MPCLTCSKGRAGRSAARTAGLHPLAQLLHRLLNLVRRDFPVLVAVDLGLPPVRGRAPLAAWLRVARNAAAHQAVVLVGSPYRLSGCAANVVVVAGFQGTSSGLSGLPEITTLGRGGSDTTAVALAAALLAGLLPAWRSTRIQPATALREE